MSNIVKTTLHNPSKVNLLNHSNLYIQIGAPRTGTSFLRKEIFPNISNVRFANKQIIKTEITSHFEQLAHYGDGDELSISATALAEPDMGASDSKVLVSEEHLLWSVYHMFGNVGSRALMLKRRFPDAKILLSVRRQPEFLLSVYAYLKSMNQPELGDHLKSPWRFVNYTPRVESLRVKKFLGIPSGLDWNEYPGTYDISNEYFNRRSRHFIAADFSWLSLYNIYVELFGNENVLLVPQEIWREKPMIGIGLLEEFIGEKINTKGIDFNLKVNSLGTKARTDYEGNEKFINFVQELVRQDNDSLNSLLDHDHLRELGYTEDSSAVIQRISIGFGKQGIADTRVMRAFELLRQQMARTGPLLATIAALRFLAARAIQLLKFKQRFYRLRRGFFDKFRGLDFERIESLDRLSLKPSISEQYEGSKLEELEELFRKINLPEPIRFLDLGSGKGRVVCYVSSLDKVEISRGIEISDRLCSVANHNISILQCENCEIICDDVQNISSDIISDSNVYYFYNPFPRVVMESVLQKILKSCNKRGLGFAIIYFNPVDSDLIDEAFAGRYVRKDYKNRISNALTSVYWIDGFHD